jgi:penicillin-binding protein 1C
MALHRPQRSHISRLLRLSRRALVAGALIALGLGLYLWLSTPLPDPARLRERAALGSTRILDRAGRPLYELPDPFSGWQRPVPLGQIAPALRQATVAVEDAGFYRNPGVDARGILRAAWSNLRSGAVVAGGSTITQQLARGFLLDPRLAGQQSIERKLREAVLALKLTARLPKDEILALYLNQVYYGGLSYGAEAAARYYFGKPAADLDLAEAALLAGLPQAPSAYDPFAHPEAARARQAQVLAAMARAGVISAEQAERAAAEPLQLAGRPPAMRAPHFVTFVIDGLAAELGPDVALRGGLTVTTTLDLDLQEAAQAALRRRLADLAAPRDGAPAQAVRGGAVVVLDPADGAILTMVGSPDFADAAAQGQVNAALALRQPGSAIKPLTYALALERGWTPATTILDVPSSFPASGGPPYAPQNYDRTFHGPLSLREALATSSNVAAVRALDYVGAPALLDLSARLGIGSLGRDAARYGLALTLGSGEVRPLELTAAFAAFANGGERVTPHPLLAIAGPDGRPLPLGALGPRPRERALAPQVAYLISDILADRYARMRAFGAAGPLDVGRPAAAKTGTTSDWRDNWTVGYSPDRAVGVWVGNPDGRPMRGVSGLSGAGPVWHDVMLAAHRGLPARPFARPPGVVEVIVCVDSGLLPSPACPATRAERFIAGSAPTRADDAHLAVRVDPRLGCRAPAGYPAERTITRIFYLPPPGAEAWAAAQGLPAPPRAACPAPAAAGGAGGAASPAPSAPPPAAPTGVPALLAPGDGALFRLTPGVPLERQRLALEAQAGPGAVSLSIVVDGAAVASFGEPPYRAFWQLRPGAHAAWVEIRDAVGNLSRSPAVRFIVTE